MAKLTKTDLVKVKDGQLKYWWPFIEMVENATAFKLGAQGEKGAVVIGYSRKSDTTKMLNKMKACITATQARSFLTNINYTFPTTNGQTVGVTALWKENVKPMKSDTGMKIGGRETEVFSEVLAQFCLAYAIHYGEASTASACLIREGNANDFKDDVFSACKKYIITPSTFNLNNETFRKKLALFASQPLGESGAESKEIWIETQGAAMKKLKDKYNIGKNVKIYNDKIFGGSAFAGNPYSVYLKANPGPGIDKWNPADMWVMTPKGLQAQVHINRTIKSQGKVSINVANNFLMEQFKTGDIIPVSLKKPSVPAHVVVMNSDEYFERIVLGKTSNPTIEITEDNRDVKINFTLETVQIPSTRGLKAALAARMRGSAPNGKVVEGSQKHIRIKYHVNNKKIELEYTQSGQPSLARAKMGSLGNKNFTSIINGTTKEGIKKLNKIQENYNDIGVKTDPWFNGQLDKLDPAQYARLQSYVGELWKAITNDNAPDFSKIAALNDVGKLSGKAMAAEFGLSIGAVSNDRIRTRLITHLYEACASVAFGSGLNRDERALLAASGDVAPARRISFNASVHVKVY